MASPDRIAFAHEGALELGQKVIVGIVDVAAVGARVLLSLEPPEDRPGWTVRETPLQLRGLQQSPAPSSAGGEADRDVDGAGGGGDGGGAVRPVLTTEPSSSSSSSKGAAPAAALLRNFYSGEGGSGAPQISMLILNAVVPEGAQAEVAAALVELLEAGRGSAEGGADSGGTGPAGAAPRSLTIAAAMLLQQLAQPAALHQHLLNGVAPLDAALPPLPRPRLPSTTSSSPSSASTPIRVRDGQLAALLHVLDVSGTPAVCLLAPGHKPPASTSLDLPGSAPACDAIGAALAAAFGLRYDIARCRAVRALYKWFVPEKAAGSDVMYL